MDVTTISLTDTLLTHCTQLPGNAVILHQNFTDTLPVFHRFITVISTLHHQCSNDQFHWYLTDAVSTKHLADVSTNGPPTIRPLISQ